MSAGMESDHEEKKHKRSRRKQRQEEDGDNMAVEDTPQPADSAKKEKKKHKDKKRKERSEDVEAVEAEVEPAASPDKKHKRHKSDDKKEKKSKRALSSSLPERPAKAAESHQARVPDAKEYPFYTQTFSQRIPIWPASFDEPLTKTSREYLDPMLNRYSPKFRGVLLEYKNVNLSHRPQRADPRNPPTDDTPVLLEAVECYAPPFAWLTADLHLFIPSRGAWMEGVINLQSEGHIGVVCFDKFNAAISRRSLPRGWSWVDQPDEEYHEEAPAAEEEEEDPFTEKAGGDEAAGDEDAGFAHEVRSSGHWVDENGARVSGKVHFRIKNFSSGSTGDYTYLSLQGTMLDEEAERKAVAEDREAEKARKARQNTGGLLYSTMRLPEFSMTKLKDDLI